MSAQNFRDTETRDYRYMRTYMVSTHVLTHRDHDGEKHLQNRRIMLHASEVLRTRFTTNGDCSMQDTSARIRSADFSERLDNEGFLQCNTMQYLVNAKSRAFVHLSSIFAATWAYVGVIRKTGSCLSSAAVEGGRISLSAQRKCGAQRAVTLTWWGKCKAMHLVPVAEMTYKRAGTERMDRGR